MKMHNPPQAWELIKEIIQESGIEDPLLNKIVKEKKKITPDLAEYLSNMIGKSPAFWLRF